MTFDALSFCATAAAILQIAIFAPVVVQCAKKKKADINNQPAVPAKTGPDAKAVSRHQQQLVSRIIHLRNKTTHRRQPKEPSDKSKDQKKEKDKKNGKKDTNDTKKEKKGTPKPEKGDPKKDATEEYQEVCWPTWLRLQVAASRQAPLGRLPIRRTVATTSRRRTISRRRRMKSPRRRRKRRSWLLARRASVSGLNHRLRYASRFQLASTPLSILRRSRSQRRPVRKPRTTMFVAHEMHMLIFDL